MFRIRVNAEFWTRRLCNWPLCECTTLRTLYAIGSQLCNFTGWIFYWLQSGV